VILSVHALHHVILSVHALHHALYHTQAGPDHYNVEDHVSIDNVRTAGRDHLVDSEIDQGRDRDHQVIVIVLVVDHVLEVDRMKGRARGKLHLLETEASASLITASLPLNKTLSISMIFHVVKETWSHTIKSDVSVTRISVDMDSQRNDSMAHATLMSVASKLVRFVSSTKKAANPNKEKSNKDKPNKEKSNKGKPNKENTNKGKPNKGKPNKANPTATDAVPVVVKLFSRLSVQKTVTSGVQIEKDITSDDFNENSQAESFFLSTMVLYITV
jgi:hypothetical protein